MIEANSNKTDYVISNCRIKPDIILINLINPFIMPKYILISVEAFAMMSSQMIVNFISKYKYSHNARIEGAIPGEDRCIVGDKPLTETKYSKEQEKDLVIDAVNQYWHQAQSELQKKKFRGY